MDLTHKPLGLFLMFPKPLNQPMMFDIDGRLSIYKCYSTHYNYQISMIKFVNIFLAKYMLTIKKFVVQIFLPHIAKKIILFLKLNSTHDTLLHIENNKEEDKIWKQKKNIAQRIK